MRLMNVLQVCIIPSIFSVKAFGAPIQQNPEVAATFNAMADQLSQRLGQYMGSMDPNDLEGFLNTRMELQNFKKSISDNDLRNAIRRMVSNVDQVLVSFLSEQPSWPETIVAIP